MPEGSRCRPSSRERTWKSWWPGQPVEPVPVQVLAAEAVPVQVLAAEAPLPVAHGDGLFRNTLFTNHLS